MTDVTKLIGVLATMRTLLTTYEPKRTLGRVCIKQQRVKLSTFFASVEGLDQWCQFCM